MEEGVDRIIEMEEQPEKEEKVAQQSEEKSVTTEVVKDNNLDQIVENTETIEPKSEEKVLKEKSITLLEKMLDHLYKIYENVTTARFIYTMIMLDVFKTAGEAIIENVNRIIDNIDLNFETTIRFGEKPDKGVGILDVRNNSFDYEVEMNTIRKQINIYKRSGFRKGERESIKETMIRNVLAMIMKSSVNMILYNIVVLYGGKNEMIKVMIYIMSDMLITKGLEIIKAPMIRENIISRLLTGFLWTYRVDWYTLSLIRNMFIPINEIVKIIMGMLVLKSEYVTRSTDG